jgi:predicted aminopeptidase
MPTRVPPVHRVVALLVASAVLAGCYPLQAVRGQLELLGARRPLAEVSADPTTAPRTVTSLAIAAEARDLTRAALGTHGGSYASFVELPREWPVWNLTVAPELAVEPRRQCFAFIGCLAYRGFFREADARAALEAARARGDDAFLAPVPAYSTLGWFDDPLLWSMLRWDDATLAAMVAHEIAHESLYTGDDTSFDEAYAETVGAAVVRRMFATPARAAALAGWQAQQRRAARRTALLLAARRDLAALYDAGLTDEAKRSGKRQRLAELSAALGAVDPRWATEAWDNARLASTATYAELVPGFDALLAEEGDDLARFRARAAALAEQEPVRRRAALAAAARSAQAASRSSAERPE